ncbi:MAG: thiamine biosynthesis protein ThiS [Acidobacteriota bacterium]
MSAPATAESITARVNGLERRIAVGTTVADLVAELGVDPRTVAVERNGEIAPRASWGATTLADGDRLEVVRFVQGG